MNPLISEGLLAAALVLGQTSEPPSGSPSSVPPPPTLPMSSAQTAPAPPAPQRGPIISFFMREDRPVLSKISGWFKREQPETPPPSPASPPPVKGLLQREPFAPAPADPIPPASNDFPRRLPNPSSKASSPAVTVAQSTTINGTPATEIVQTSHQQVSAAKSPILARFANKIGRDEKFEWITGQLEMENGVFVLYYATPETVDKYHGRMVLQPQKVDMKALHRGDLVSVRGQLALRPTASGTDAVYRLTTAFLIERPKL